MKKIFGLGLLMAMSVLFIVSCGGGVDPEEAIVGTWYSEADGRNMTFHEDGTGTTGAIEFYWEIEDDYLILNPFNTPVYMTNTIKFKNQDKATVAVPGSAGLPGTLTRVE